MDLLTKTIESIGQPDGRAMEAARSRQDILTKPKGALGALEALSVRLAGIYGAERPRIDRKAVIVMAGDHGVTVEGVSAYPSEVTPQMVLNFAGGGAAINVLSRLVGAKVTVVDVGVASDIVSERVEDRKVRRGTANIATGPAMSREEAVRSLEVGIDAALREIEEGADILAAGDMGIGNTTASSAVIACLTGSPVALVTGKGTGIDDAVLERKRSVIERALRVNSPDAEDPLDVLAKVGGVEIGAMAGVFLAAAASRVPAMIDGFISGAAALLAAKLEPKSVEFMVASHMSVEPGHAVALEALGLRPLFRLDMRLGEGTGAVLGMFFVEAAARILDEMATFDEAGVSDKEKTAT